MSCIVSDFRPESLSSLSQPSAADRSITEQLRTALATIEVSVLDHIIIGKGKPFSFAEAGLI